MQLSSNQILEYLITADIEGLIAAGAPADEYRDEALLLSEAFRQLPEQSEENLLATATLIWANSFDLSPEEMALRIDAIRRVVRKII